MKRLLFSGWPRRTRPWGFEFLQQTPEVPRRASPNTTGDHPQTPHLENNDRAVFKSKPLQLTRKIGIMGRAYLRRDWKTLEHVFESTPQLQRRPAAVNFMVRAYCHQKDFTVAKALLFQFGDHLKPLAPCQFIWRCAHVSLNAADVEEVYRRFGAEGVSDTSSGAAVSVAALLAFRKLGDNERYDRVLRESRARWGAQSPEMLQVQIFDDIVMSGDWSSALMRGRRVLELTRTENYRFRARNVYQWVALHFSRNADWKSLTKLARHMSDLGLTVKPQFSALALREIPQRYPEILPHEWLRECIAQGWSVGPDAVGEMLDELSIRFPHKGAEITAKKLQLGLPRYRPISSSSPDPDLAAMRHRPDRALQILDDMVHRSLKPPYYHCVLAFNLLAGRDDARPQLRDLLDRIAQWGYPKHCAGIDLAMVELIFREVRTSTDREGAFNIGRQLVSEYLMQYPIIQHDRVQLTRLAELLLAAGDPTNAAVVLDNLRQTQSISQRYTARTHDSASLTVGIRIRAATREPVTPFIDEAIRDRPLVMLDSKFRRKLSEVLNLQNETRDVLDRVRNHNAWVSSEVDAEIERIASFLDS